jgi:hypothetical protein
MISGTTQGQHPSQVVDVANEMARHWARQPQTRITTLQVLKPFTPPTRDPAGKWMLQALHSLKTYWTFVREPTRHAGGPGEVIQSLPLTISLNFTGDCDDWCCMIATMAKCVGLPVKIGYVWQKPGFAHIIVAVRAGFYEDAGPWYIIDPDLKEPTDASTYPDARWSTT